MFEKISQAAEQVATNVSRRQFLGRLGRAAMATAAAIGGVAAFAGDARADKPVVMCDATSSSNNCLGVPVGTVCFDAGPHDPSIGVCRSPRGSTSCYCYVKVKGNAR